MSTKEIPEPQKKLAHVLAALTGHLEAGSSQERQSLQELQETLAHVLPDEDLATIKDRYFSVEGSDLFFTDTIPPEELNRLHGLASRTLKKREELNLRVFVRDVPVRAAQVPGSVPAWAVGAAPEKSFGPFLNKDGRQIWFDFFKIKKLLALYIEGRPDPALLFEVASSLFVVIHQGKPAGLAKKYTLVGETVWINSQLLAKTAPAGFYTALRISGGEIILSTAPKMVGGKLTITVQTKVTVKLDLAQPQVTDADPASPYGIDARQGTLHLPRHLSFHFSGGGSAITSIIGETTWNLYGESGAFKWNPQATPVYDNLLNLILVPFTYSKSTFAVQACASPFTTLAGAAEVKGAAWALPLAQIDITKPLPAAGIGGMGLSCKKGLSAAWQGLKGDEVHLASPYVFYSPGWINVTDFMAGSLYGNQEYKLWQDYVRKDEEEPWQDHLNPYGSSLKLQYTAAFPVVYHTFANGNEVLLALTNANPLIDRPVKVCGERLDIHSQKSILILAVNKAWRLIYLYDDNILFDMYDPGKAGQDVLKPISLALRNALFKLTPANGLLLFGRLAEDMVKVERAALFLTFGMYAYLPILPDPYAANLNQLRYQFGRPLYGVAFQGGGQAVQLWLVCQVKWQPADAKLDTVDVSFHFAPLQNQFQGALEAASVSLTASPAPAAGQDLATSSFIKLFSAAGPPAAPQGAGPGAMQLMMLKREVPDYQKIWDERFSRYQGEAFSLLDVSSNADQMGVSFASFDDRRLEVIREFEVVRVEAEQADQFPIQVEGLDVVARSRLVRAFTVPQISWEPVLNLTLPEPVTPGDPPNPPFGPNYYPDDGGPTRLMNNSTQFVPIAPIPVTKFLVESYKKEIDNLTQAYFTLPFGMRSLAYLYRTGKPQDKPPALEPHRPKFKDDVQGGIQLKLTGGSPPNPDMDEMFKGYTLQINNVLDFQGSKTGASTLGHDVAAIFNENFFSGPTHSVPLKRMEVSGYGASIFSNWINKKALFATTSQALFNVFVGRCAHEVVQVKSMLYPWGIRVVRTVTLFRVGSAYVYRYDSGWRAESDGKFDFRFDCEGEPNPVNPYKIHPGVVKGLFNVRNIRTAVLDLEPFKGSMNITGFFELDPATWKVKHYSGGPSPVEVDLEPVYFDADVELENVVQGQVNGRVPGKGIVGFVQLKPMGIPLKPGTFKELVAKYVSIGGPLDCIMDIGKTGQKLRINRVDVNNSTDATNTQPVLAAAVRGSVILPKDGSWSMVTHAYATGDVTPLPETLPVPLIREGELDDKLNYATDKLLRIAHPTELLRQPVNETVNFGYLQSTHTQKVLFLTPAYTKPVNDTTPGKLLSKTPPLFADPYRLVNSKAIFPKIGNAVTNFGDAIALTKNFNFAPGGLMDGGKQVLELMGINTADGVTKLLEEGYRLLKGQADALFDLPLKPWYLINEDYLKVYVKYAANTPGDGKLNFNVNSFAGAVGEKWKSLLKSISMVVDLGPFPELLTIKGNFDAKKGSEANYPQPELVFSKDLQPVIDVLIILEQIQGGDYADALKKGLKIAMSNNADSWEYKFEASKEFPLLKFPPGLAYDQPQVPLKLEAAMRVGVYFNSALTTAALGDPKKLLPTAGAFMDFYGRLSVMCVSLAVATVYAVGQVNLAIAADTKVGPSLNMKFGFGAQVVVGLPVVGSVSVLYMVGVEIYADSAKLNISAFLLFQGHADLLAGLISVTITIEAKGSISRKVIAPGEERTDCIATVTFGLDISIFLVINISFEESWSEERQISGILPFP